MKFGERLSETLKAKGINQKDFAKKIGFAQQTVNGWCSGNHEPSLSVIVLICKELGESSDWLLGLVD